MKPYEFVLLVVIVALFYAGMYFYGDGATVLGILCYVAVGTLAIGYLYLAKLRPIGLAKQTILAVAERNGFVQLLEKPQRKAVAKLMRQFPGFGDFCLDVDLLHGMQNESGVYYLGRYGLGGAGSNFGCFVIGALPSLDTPDSFTLDKVLDHGGQFDFQAELALGEFPANVREALREFPYDFHFRGRCFMADIDARQLRQQGLGELLNGLIGALSSLGAA